MSHQLFFSVLHNYDSGDASITIPIELINGQHAIKLLAKLDTGASYCIFERGYGEALGLDIESGYRQQIGTAINSFTTYGHEISLSALGFNLNVVAYFAVEQSFRRNVLGRFGWLQQLQIAIIDYDGKLYVNSYQ